MSNLEELKAATVFSMGEENKMFEKYFIEKSYLNLLTKERIMIANVTFEPGCAS